MIHYMLADQLVSQFNTYMSNNSQRKQYVSTTPSKFSTVCVATYVWMFLTLMSYNQQAYYSRNYPMSWVIFKHNTLETGFLFVIRCKSSCCFPS